MHLIMGKLQKDLHDIASRAAPEEAVGLILSDGKVIELTNIAEGELKHSGFVINKDEVIDALDGVDHLEDVTLWHSHPGGGVGPSRLDLRSKTPLGYHLVVSLVGNQLVSAWY